MLVLALFAVLFGGGAAVESCPASTMSCPCIPGRPGREGEQGPPGPPGTLSSDQREELKLEVIEFIRNNVLNKGISEHYPATSCKEIYDCNPLLLLGTTGSGMQQGVPHKSFA